MAHDKSIDDELAKYYRDPPPPVPSDRKGHKVDGMSEQLREWGKRNGEYLASPDFRALHQLPSISPLWGYDESYFRIEIINDLIHITRLAGRRLTPDEMALYLHHASKSTVAKSYDRPAAIAATLFLINRGWKGYTFPFYQPTSQHFNPRVFPSPSWPLLRGRIAAASWQGLRCGLYGGFGLLTYHMLAPRYRSLFTYAGLIALEVEPGLDRLQYDVWKETEA
ncbi:hypothetical protein B0T24DRAFT_608698 [Lasiosphaeria ovina]|uniref:Uncharacterized protein n=1 Tax=Lasiosphaeria ovina TaxID=92902 RepID=A0AAE0NN39_9PEZI|nr:hypothetical protein B0T24DRAFT_608698 [Lasiosphaeria ovina]